MTSIYSCDRHKAHRISRLYLIKDPRESINCQLKQNLDLNPGANRIRAVKDLRHRVWGIHFRIDVDAKFLIEMVKQPDLPNAPMTRWISYIALFDYVMNHVPAQSHAGADGLSRRRRTPEDSEDEDAEEYLDKFMGSGLLVSSPPPSFSLINFLSSESLNTFRPTRLDNNFFKDLLLTMRSVRRSSSLDWKKDRNRTEPNRKRPDHRLRLHKF